MHLWHDIDPLNSKGFIRVIIEIPMGSRNKYELDKELGIMTLNRTLLTPCRYPANYGFIPKALGKDNDPLDVIVYSQESLFPSTLVTVRPIGVFSQITDGEIDYKIIAVVAQDPEFGDAKMVCNLAKFRVRELKEFISIYKDLYDEKVLMGKILGRSAAWNVIRKSMNAYSKLYSK